MSGFSSWYLDVFNRWYLAEQARANVPSLKEAQRQFDRWYWLEALRRGHTVIGAARLAGVNRSTAVRFVRRTGLLRADFELGRWSPSMEAT